MTKADLIEEVSRALDLTRKESDTIIDAIFDGIVKALRRGEKTELRGFGTFRTRQRRSRIGRNPTRDAPLCPRFRGVFKISFTPVPRRVNQGKLFVPQ